VLATASALVTTCHQAPAHRTGVLSRAPGQSNTALESLGAALFADISLSRDTTIACATCHNPAHGFSEPRATSRGIGAKSPKRNAQSVADLARQRLLTWNGRLINPEEQVQEAFSVDGDMGIDLDEVIRRIGDNRSYRQQFAIVFRREPDAEGIIDAIIAFEQSLTTGRSRFDCFLYSGDSSALSSSERRGWELFMSPRAACAGCHSPFQADPPALGIAWFADHRFHNLGVGFVDGQMTDVGRYEVTKSAKDWGAFRTPSLRNVALTAPYMHDGSLATLGAVVEFYSRGGVVNPNLDRVMGPRALSLGEQSDLVAFLYSLTAMPKQVELGHPGEANAPGAAVSEYSAAKTCRTYGDAGFRFQE
jgi:cytochrome c peroxidase